ncbi:MAG: DUF427 domain-containing protein [Myxococcota bacterium]
MTDHISVAPYPRRVVVRFGGEVIVDTRAAVALKEGRIPPRLYFPRDDVKMDFLERTRHSTHCPYKGDAAYYSLKVGDNAAANAVWTYEQPIEQMKGITGLLSFYPQQVDIEEHD